jgi:hypothetical protein
VFTAPSHCGECLDLAIGHAAPVRDKDALAFSRTLYECLCQGMSLAGSFDTARSAASLGYRIYANADARAFCPGGAGDTTRACGNDGSEGPSGKRARTSEVTVRPRRMHHLMWNTGLDFFKKIKDLRLGVYLGFTWLLHILRNHQNAADKCQASRHKKRYHELKNLLCVSS